jgi:hypothetical protein
MTEAKKSEAGGQNHRTPEVRGQRSEDRGQRTIFDTDYTDFID